MQRPSADAHLSHSWNRTAPGFTKVAFHFVSCLGKQPSSDSFCLVSQVTLDDSTWRTPAAMVSQDRSKMVLAWTGTDGPMTINVATFFGFLPSPSLCPHLLSLSRSPSETVANLWRNMATVHDAGLVSAVHNNFWIENRRPK